MPKRWNLERHAVVLDWNNHIVVQPGKSHDFTDEQIAAGLAGLWGEEDPRAGLKAEREFKQKRDQKDAPPEPSPSEDTTDPAAEPEKE